MRLAGAITAAALLALVPTADAATVRVVDRPVGHAEDCPSGVPNCTYAAIEYRAAAGEANQLDVAAAGPERTYRLRDDGADVQPGPGCEPQGARQVRCTVSASARYAELDVFLGDMNDTATIGVPILDLVKGEAGDDVLTGNDFGNTLNGGAGRDRLVGGAGPDFLNGGTGTDPDAFVGGGGSDEVDYTDRRSRVKVNLGVASYPSGQKGEGDTLDGIEIVRGGRGSDLMRAGNAYALFYGGPGSDRLSATMAPASLRGESGNDRLTGGQGRDDLHGEAGDDTLRGGCERDVLDAGSGNDRIYAADGYPDRVGGGSGTDFAEFDQLDTLRHVERRRALHIDGCAL